MGARWFEISPLRHVEHKLYCGRDGCAYFVTGHSVGKVLKKLRKHRHQVHGK